MTRQIILFCSYGTVLNKLRLYMGQIFSRAPISRLSTSNAIATEQRIGLNTIVLR